MNKADKFYSKKTIDELLETIRLHSLRIRQIDSLWYDYLLIHIKSRELNEEQKSKLELYLSDNLENPNLGNNNITEINVSNRVDVLSYKTAGQKLINAGICFLIGSLCFFTTLLISEKISNSNVDLSNLSSQIEELKGTKSIILCLNILGIVLFSVGGITLIRAGKSLDS